MKSLFPVVTALTAVLANDFAAMEAQADTWCITYETTYLAKITNQGILLPSEQPVIDEPSRFPFIPSIRPTFRNTSIIATRSAMRMKSLYRFLMDTDFTTGTQIQDALISESSLFNPGIIAPSSLPPGSSMSSDLVIDPTAAQSMVETFTTTIGDTAVPTGTGTKATSTPTETIEPPGRAVIFLIQITDDEQRTLHRRASRGFVGNNNPNVCTFATTFDLAEGQLFDGGVPIYYSGESYKELAGQGTRPGGSITTEFSESGNILMFRNAELPNGQAGFCQDADGQIFITFSAIPPGCTPISLVTYDASRCQNGRLDGIDELGSSWSEIIVTEATSIGGTATSEAAVTTQSGSQDLSLSTNLFLSQSLDPDSQKTSATLSSSFTSETFISLSSETSDSSQQEPTETDSQTESFSTESKDSTTLPSLSVTSKFFTEGSGQSSSSDKTGLPTTSNTEFQTTTEINTIVETTGAGEDTTQTSATETDGPNTHTKSGESTTTEAETTNTDTTTGIGESTTTGVGTTSTDSTAGIEESTTTETETTTVDTTTIPEELTTTEVETTTADPSTTTGPTTTTEATSGPQVACGGEGESTSRFTVNGVTFEQFCQTGGIFYSLGGSLVVTANFVECLQLCSQNSNCKGVGFFRFESQCALCSSIIPDEPQDDFDFARVV